jgi:hypothetical protein
MSVLLIIDTQYINKCVRCITPINSKHALLVIAPHMHDGYRAILGVVGVPVVEMIASEQPERLLLFYF